MAVLIKRNSEDIKNLTNIVATKTEVEDLAVMTQKGFEEVHERFKDIDDRMATMDNRMATKDDLKSFMTKDDLRAAEERLGVRIDNRFSSLDKETETLHEWVSDLDARVNKIEDKIVLAK